MKDLMKFKRKEMKIIAKGPICGFLIGKFFKIVYFSTSFIESSEVLEINTIHF